MTTISIDDLTAEEIIHELRLRNSLDGLAASALPQESRLSHFDTEQLVDTLRAKEKVIYGTDDRQDVFQVADRALVNDADSVVALFQANQIRDNGDGTSTLLTQNFGAARNLCQQERFRNQPIGAFCSGFLVAPDIIATAGHCVNAGNVTTVRFVFGYRMLDANNAQTVIRNTEIYSGVSVIGRQQVNNGADWSLVRIDRAVTNHPIVKIRRSGRVGNNQALHVIGHPVGLPEKVAGGASVRDNAPNAFFVANLDTYGGNSGSPVFNDQTHEVEGVLVRGETDFVSSGNCMVSRVCPDGGCRGEDCTRTTEFSDLVPIDIQAVPGWFGWENQGADIAIADISGNGRPDLVVFHIDNPGGENHGYYRIGWDLNVQGHVTGGWSPVMAVPGWFGAEDQGAGIAIADISGNGRPDLVVFHIDNPGGENHGYYRIGWDLDAQGRVTGGWSPIMAVPGWFGAEDQGAGIAIADISGNGRPDLVVFHIDNPGGENHGYYRIGWSLDQQGRVTGGWSAVMPVPGWFGWENQDGGIAIADIDGSGRPDLLVFHLDNPGGENHGYYRIGGNLSTQGIVTGGWGPVTPVPGWFGAEDQGAGVALWDINGDGRQDLVVFHVDNPGGDNHGYYRVIPTV